MQRLNARIGLLDHIGGGNLGDDATQHAVVRNIKKRQPGALVSLFSMNPADSRSRHGLPCYPIARRTWQLGYGKISNEPPEKDPRMCVPASRSFFSRMLRAIRLLLKLPAEAWREMVFLLASFQTVKTLDLLIINGGGQLTDWCGPWSFPYRIYKWVLLAKLARVRCLFLNVGAGPLSHPVAKLFARHALRAAAYVSFRDRESQTLTREVGFLGQSDVLPDSVYSLEIPAIRRDPSQTVAKSVVGLSPKLGLQALQMPESKSPAACGDFVETLARFACWLDGKSYLLALFGTDIGEDPLAVKDLETAIRKRRNGTAMVSSGSYAVTSLDDLLSAMAAMDYVVTCRFHGIIFAHLLNKPVLAISPHPKVKTLMKDLDLASYCVDARECDLHRLTDAFAALVSNADAIRTRMAERLSSYRSQLAVQFDELFPGTAQ